MHKERNYLIQKKGATNGERQALGRVQLPVWDLSLERESTCYLSLWEQIYGMCLTFVFDE